MLGSRRKAHAKKSKSKSKSKALSLTNATSEDSEFNDLTDDIDGAKGWNEIVNVLCEFLRLPGKDAEQPVVVILSLKSNCLSHRPV